MKVPADIEKNTAVIISEKLDKYHPIPIPRGDVIEKINIILIAINYEAAFLLKLTPYKN